jgi:hypothetical protein
VSRLSGSGQLCGATKQLGFVMYYQYFIVCVCLCACGWLSWLHQWFQKYAVRVPGDLQSVPKGSVDTVL